MAANTRKRTKSKRKTVEQRFKKSNIDPSLKKLIKKIEKGETKLKLLKRFEFGYFEYLSDRILSQVKTANDEDNKGNLIAVILLQSAALECFLNDVLIHFARETFGKGSKAIAEAFIAGSGRSKIFRVVPILSKATKILDAESKQVKDLLTLIKIQNNISHTTEHYLDEFHNYDKRIDEPLLTDTLNIKQCQQYQKSLNEFICAVWNGPIENPPWQHKLIKDAESDKDD
jgi:hypothetical protein